jgi:CheY-like chemotaxis protein
MNLSRAASLHPIKTAQILGVRWTFELCAVLSRIESELPIYLSAMSHGSTLLCIHRNPSALEYLQEKGYELLTAANGREGLQLFMSQPVDAIVLEYQLGLLDGSVIADEIKQVRPELPIVMWADHADLPNGALKSVDALVSTSDPPHFVWAAVHFVLNVKQSRRYEPMAGTQTSSHLRRHVRSGEGPEHLQAKAFRPAIDPLDDKAASFSPRVWRSILKGTVQF